MDQEHRILVDQLRIGVYVMLDVGWMHHPFSFNNFKIRDHEQLETIRQLGLKHVRWDPDRSDASPMAIEEAHHAGAGGKIDADGSGNDAQHDAKPRDEPATKVAPEVAAMLAAKEARGRRLAEHRRRIVAVERAFVVAAHAARDISKNIYSQPEKTFANASTLIEQMVESLLAAPELAIQVMPDRIGGEETYFHSLNVSVLAMTLAREMSVPAEIVRLAGLGALFHDIGLNEIPSRILLNPAPLTRAERDLREMHCEYGARIAREAGMPVNIVNIIFQHHELYDGGGYPRRLAGESIDALARLVGVVNAYDNLCNPVNAASALTPHEALSQMFAQQRRQFDPKILQTFIRFMGVYPPGTVVGLSNETIGLVIKVNAARPLRPTLIVYDPSVPRQDAILLDLEEESDANISRAIRPGALLPEVFDYLSPRRRVSYYFDAGAGRAEA